MAKQKKNEQEADEFRAPVCGQCLEAAKQRGEKLDRVMKLVTNEDGEKEWHCPYHPAEEVPAEW